MELNNLQQTENSQENHNASLIFAKTLGLIFEDGEGIVINISENMKMPEEIKKVIVFKYMDQIHIYKCDQDLEEGTTVNMQDTSNSEPQTETN